MKRTPVSPVREKSHRLPKENYIGKWVDFTLCLSPRISLLNREDIFPKLEELLIEASYHYDCDVVVYMFMPDHLHSILASRTSSADPLSAIKRFKQRSGYWLRQQSVVWQKGFYDHILRRDADLDHHIRYILANPIRAGLSSTWKAYPFKGSTIHPIDTWEEIP